MNIEHRYSSPILVIGYRGYPINGFCYDVIYKGEIVSKYNFSRSDNMHAAYSLGFEDYKKGAGDYLYAIEKYTGTLEEFVARRYFKNPIKRKMYSLYLFIGRWFK